MCRMCGQLGLLTAGLSSPITPICVQPGHFWTFWCLLQAYSPGWWLLPSLTLGTFITHALRRPFKVPVLLYVAEASWRQLSPWVAAVATILMLGVTVFGALLAAELARERLEREQAGGFGTYTPLSRDVPPGCRGAAACVLRARNYFEARYRVMNCLSPCCRCACCMPRRMCVRRRAGSARGAPEARPLCAKRLHAPHAAPPGLPLRNGLENVLPNLGELHCTGSLQMVCTIWCTAGMRR